MGNCRVLVLVGSLRKASYSRMLARALERLAPASPEFEYADIGHLPHYNQDIEDSGDLPESWVQFRQQVRSAGALLFVTPEYNRSIPGVLKNAIDIASRPKEENAWSGKPGAVVSISRGSLGGFGANHHLRQALTAVNVPVMAHPEAYIGNIATLFDEQGNLANESTAKFLSQFMRAFAQWVEKNR